MKDAFEEKSEENRQLTGKGLKVMFSEYQETLLSVIDKRLSDLVKTIVPVPGKSDGQEFPDDFAEVMMDDYDHDNDKALVAVQQQHRLYTFGGRFWHVPENFAFPKNAKLLLGWILWVGGQVGYEYLNKAGMNQLAPVRPFRILKKKMI